MTPKTQVPLTLSVDVADEFTVLHLQNTYLVIHNSIMEITSKENLTKVQLENLKDELSIRFHIEQVLSYFMPSGDFQAWKRQFDT